MKIGTITFHFASNQGAVLQCYALQKYLEKAGYDVSVINYMPSYHTVRYKTKKNPFLYARGYWRKFFYKKATRRIYLTIRSFVRCVYMNFKLTDGGVEECYEEFRKAHLKLTREYYSISELRRMPPDCEAYISGSDQVWNPEVLDQKFDEAYFLRFGDEKKIRIAYAVSIGKEMSEKYLRQIGKLTENIDAISLREYNSDVVKEIKKKVHICIDPTFLLDAEDYGRVERDIDPQTPYIFVYGFESNEDIFKAIDMAKEVFCCRVINGSPMKVKYQSSDETIREYGPDSFLSYIKNATCIVTNSFHAITFSIIYKKRFIAVPHSTRGLRMKSLLGRLGLRSCLFCDDLFDINEKIDYDRVHINLNEWRQQSRQFLDMALSGKNGEEIPCYENEEFTYEA